MSSTDMLITVLLLFWYGDTNLWKWVVQVFRTISFSHLQTCTLKLIYFCLRTGVGQCSGGCSSVFLTPHTRLCHPQSCHFVWPSSACHFICRQPRGLTLADTSWPVTQHVTDSLLPALPPCVWPRFKLPSLRAAPSCTEKSLTVLKL